MHPANQRLREPDKLSKGAHSQTSYPTVQWGNTWIKRGTVEPQKKWRNRERQRQTETNKQEAESKSRGEHKSHRAGARAYKIPMLQEARNRHKA